MTAGSRGPEPTGVYGDASPGGVDTAVWQLRLYVAGESPKSVEAYFNLKKLCEEYLAGRYEIEVIDLVEQPALARSHDIIAIPTLVRQLPHPLRKIIGDLSNTQGVLIGLQLEPRVRR